MIRACWGGVRRRSFGLDGQDAQPASARTPSRPRSLCEKTLILCSQTGTVKLYPARVAAYFYIGIFYAFLCTVTHFYAVLCSEKLAFYGGVKKSCHKGRGRASARGKRWGLGMNKTFYQKGKHNSYISRQRYGNDWAVSFINLKGLRGFQCLDGSFASIRSRG